MLDAYVFALSLLLFNKTVDIIVKGGILVFKIIFLEEKLSC